MPRDSVELLLLRLGVWGVVVNWFFVVGVVLG